MTYQCERCGKMFPKKYNYDRHINKKVPCSIVIYQSDNINISEFAENKCEYCNKFYSTKYNLNKHKKKCTITTETQKEKMYQRQIEQMKQTINELTKKVGNNYIINQQIDQSVHQQNIQINTYGNENLNYITRDDVEKLLSHPPTCIPKFIKLIHYNEHHPENQNVILDNIKENLIRTLNSSDKWNYTNFEKFVEQFTIEKYDQIIDLYGNGENGNFNEVVKEKFENWADEFDIRESCTRKQAEEDAKMAIITGSKWVKDHKLTKRAVKKILDGEFELPPKEKEEFFSLFKGKNLISNQK